jgi:crotonobetainyl-CoA:carnitine CoA-transferase CaiB-like acyl-CoA transferase
VKNSDLVWENFRSGISKRLKLDYGSIKDINPGITSCSIGCNEEMLVNY